MKLVFLHTLRRPRTLVQALGTTMVAFLALMGGMRFGAPSDSSIQEEHAANVLGSETVYWATMGIGGMVDESGLNRYTARNARASTGPGLRPPARCTFTTSVNMPEEAILGNDTFSMTVRYRDDDPGGRVVVKLKRYDTVTGETSTLVRFDSDDYPPFDIGGYRNTKVVVTPNWDWEVDTSVYFLEHTTMQLNKLSKASLGAVILASTRDV